MDPLTIIGGIQATGAIVGVIVRTLKNLSDARDRFQNADTTFRLLISELMATKAAVVQIEDWAKYSFKESTPQRDLNEAFKISFDGVSIATEILSAEVEGLKNRNPFLMKAKIAWTETTMKEHADRLRSQVSALQLLVQAVHCQNSMQQLTLLEAPGSRRILQTVADDTSTLRASRAYSQLGSIAPSIVSHDDSTITNATFEVDQELVNTGPYRSAMAHQDSKGREIAATQPPTPILSQNLSNPFLNRSASDAMLSSRSNDPVPTVVFMEGSKADSGYYDEDADIVNPIAYREAMKAYRSDNLHRSVSAPLGKDNPRTQRMGHDEQTDQLTPMERFQTTRDWPQRPSPKMTGIDAHLAARPLVHQPSKSDSAVNLTRPTEQDLKRSPWGTLRRLASRSNFNKASSIRPEGPTMMEGMRKNAKSVRRKPETNLHESIDFRSQDGLLAPAIVRAAQSASRIEIERLIEQRADIEARHEGTGRTALAVASHCGNDAIVSLLLRHRAQVDVKDATGMTPLHLAASRGHYRVIECLLEDGASVDVSGPENKTALRFACDGGHSDCCELLLHYRAKVNARDTNMSTALHAAAAIGDLELAELLLKNGADVEAKDGNLMTALHHAAQGDFEAIVEKLLSHRADIEASGFQGCTPLCSACASGSFQAASLLISRKANTKHRAEKGLIALHFAAGNDKADLLQLLLQQPRKPPIDTKDDNGKTALHHAVQAHAFASAELLVRHGANVEATCGLTLRPMHYAAHVADKFLVDLLLSAHANIEAETQLGWRPIHFAAFYGALNVVDILLRHSAQIDPFTSKGERPLTMAATDGHLEIVKLLLDRGSAVRLRIRRSSAVEDSALCCAARNGQVEVCQELLRRGASVSERGEDNWQPLRCAAYSGHIEVVRLLLASGATVGPNNEKATADFGELGPCSFGWASGVDAERRWAVTKALEEALEQEARIPKRMNSDDPFLTVLAGRPRREQVTKIYEVG